MYGLSWAICAIGAWIIVSTWVVGSSPDAGIVINNIIVGGLTVLLGMVCAGAAMRTRST
ncbi:SPW repeat protein, partial [Streptomyces sp. SID7982]|nr:SPW repeat protein [Streptomyces sp. SID7982]